MIPQRQGREFDDIAFGSKTRKTETFLDKTEDLEKHKLQRTENIEYKEWLIKLKCRIMSLEMWSVVSL